MRMRSETPSGFMAGPRMRSSWYRTACTSIAPTASDSAGLRSTPNGAPCSPATETAIPELATQFDAMQARELPVGWDKAIPKFPADPKGIASRNSSGQVENAIAQHLLWLMGGAADLAPSTKTRLTFAEAGDFQPDNHRGRNLHFGVREHAMGAAMNGWHRVAPVRFRLPDLLRLYAQSDPAIRHHAIAGAVHLHARLDRCRRGWTNPSAR